MLTLQNIAYRHPNRDLLFDSVKLNLEPQEKIALIGNNGSGKSTLLKIIAGLLSPATGTIKADAAIWYVPQVFGQFNDLTVAAALGVAPKLQALREIMHGAISDENLALLADDWAIEERCAEAFANWKLRQLSLHQPMSDLSGGEKTKVFLAGIQLHQPGIVLMDEPSNHLDRPARQLLYDLVQSGTLTQLIVSHDRELLNMLHPVYELGKHGLDAYGGSYAFYETQRSAARTSLEDRLRSTEKALRKAKELARESIERQQKRDARGKKKQEKAGLPTISMNTLRNNAEKSTSRIAEVHAGKTAGLADNLQALRSQLPPMDKMRFDFDDSMLHKGKILFNAQGVNLDYGGGPLWQAPLDLQLSSGERLALEGPNGSGKTTIIKMLLGDLQPTTGSIERSIMRLVHVDQDYSLVDDSLTLFNQAQLYNANGLLEHEVKNRLTRFLFTPVDWDKPCHALSGGEKMRLLICCISLGNRAPDLIVLDEPTNNLDIQNIEILTAAIKDYRGTLVVVSHDSVFLERVGINRTIRLTERA